jgi:hypothetical protein
MFHTGIQTLKVLLAEGRRTHQQIFRRNNFSAPPFLKNLMGNAKKEPNGFHGIFVRFGLPDHDDPVNCFIGQFLRVIATPAIKQSDEPTPDILILPGSLLALRRQPKQQIIEALARESPLTFHEMNAPAATYLAFWGMQHDITNALNLSSIFAL